MKIHIAVNVLGLPYATLVTPGFSLPSLQTVLCGGGYTGVDFANKIHELTGAKVQVAKRSELHTFAVIPKKMAR